MTENLYYTAPNDAAFEDMKRAALEIWNSYEDPYRTEKVTRIKDIANIKDNFMYMFAMFDINNQRKCAGLLTQESRKALRDRLFPGGNEEYYLDMIGL